MRIAKNDVPTKIDAPGAKARQLTDFGDATAFGMMAAEYYSMAAGADLAPLLKGLEDDLCQSPHWGYLLEGEVTVTYKDGQEETVSGGDLFYWQAGHTVKVGKDAEMILFSPQDQHCPVIDHLHKQLSN
jgi:hypothetical protein